MFAYLLKTVNTAFNRLSERIHKMSMWDYALAAHSIATPILTKQSTFIRVLSGIAVLSSLIVPVREDSLTVPKNTNIDVYQRVMKLLNVICKERNLGLPNLLVFTKPEKRTPTCHAKICEGRLKCLKIQGNISNLSDAELSILLEHELGHFYYNDPEQLAYINRLYFVAAGLSISLIESLPLTSILGLSVSTLLRQASIRWREYRADRFAIQIAANSNMLSKEKKEDLKSLIEKLTNLDLEVSPNQANESSALKLMQTHLIKSYRNPQTSAQNLTNYLLNIFSTHPTPNRRINAL